MDDDDERENKKNVQKNLSSLCLRNIKRRKKYTQEEMWRKKHTHKVEEAKREEGKK